MQEQRVHIPLPVGILPEQQEQHREQLGSAAEHGPHDHDLLPVVPRLDSPVGAVVHVHQVVHEVVVPQIRIREGVLRKFHVREEGGLLAFGDGEDEGLAGLAAVVQVVVVIRVVVVVELPPHRRVGGG